MSMLDNSNIPREIKVSSPATPRPPTPSEASGSRERRVRRSPGASVAIQRAARRRPHGVQSRQRSPLSFHDMDVDVPQPISKNGNMLTVRIPEVLERPALNVVDPNALAACDSDLAGVPLQFILDDLKKLGPSLVAGLRQPPNMAPTINGIPATIDVLLDDIPYAPTHALAVWAKNGPTRNGKPIMRFVPVHDLFFAAMCTNLPALPPRPKQPESADGKLVRLAVVPLCLPNAHIFHITLQWMYTQDIGCLFGHFLPPFDIAIKPQTLPDFLARTYSAQQLLAKTIGLHAFWMTACALGLQDDTLWTAMQTIWRVLQEAMRLTANHGSGVLYTPSGLAAATASPVAA